jgi:PAS domain S-box-containing protein
MKLLSNPIVVRMAIVLVAAVFSFVTGTFLIRRMRRGLTEEATFNEGAISTQSVPLHAMQVIQELKQQKHELQSIQQSERWRARTSENLSAAVVSNLPSGVLLFGANGLLRQVNPAAKQILGFASPLGMSANEVFREAVLLSPSPLSLQESIQFSVRQKTPSATFQLQYFTPGGETRILDITITSVAAASGEILGAACLVSDQTEIEKIRRQQELHGELSAEMALELRNSLATIAGYGRQLSVCKDGDLARQLATDLASEAAHLEHNIGGFLASAKEQQTARA